MSDIDKAAVLDQTVELLILEECLHECDEPPVRVLVPTRDQAGWARLIKADSETAGAAGDCDAFGSSIA